MKALVTGGAGLIGSHLVDLLLENGYQVRILDNLQRPTHLNGPPPWIPPSAEFMLGDVRSKKDLYKALEGAELVFHQAAYGGFMPDISHYFHVNSVGTAMLLELIRDNGFPVRKVVVASSQAIYGEGKYQCVQEGVVYPENRATEQMARGEWEVKCPVCQREMAPLPTDECRINPKTAYAISKYSQEAIALSLGQFYGIPTVALRYAVTYGPRQSIFNPYTGICSIFSTRILNDKAPIVYEDGNQTRDFVYVRDVAAANLLVAEKEEANYQVFNVGTGKATSVLDFIALLAKIYGRDVVPDIDGSFRPGEVRHLFTDNSKIRSLGWEPQTSLEDGLGAYREWIETQGEIAEYFSQAEKLMREMKVVKSRHETVKA
jgi:dTDP-L-rhamnose 4-epimerase